jgi:NADH-quinone oxidoreductase subunit C
VSEGSILNGIKEAHSSHIESATVLQPRCLSVVAKMDGFTEVAESLKTKFGFTQPVACGAIDYPSEQRIQMIYYAMNPEHKIMLTYRLNLPRDGPKMPTLTRVWGAMDFHEREAHEMFGIEFEGHSNMIPFLLPSDWRGGHPLRKDFKGEGVTQ